MNLTCSIFLHLYYCRAPTCCSLWAPDRFKLVTYVGTELGSPEVTIEGTILCILTFDTNCKVFHYFILYHFPWSHSELHCVHVSVTAFSNRRISSGFLVLVFLSMSSCKSSTWSFYSLCVSFASSASVSD